jgi:hypothetical protein
MLDELAVTHTVIAPDLPGHGDLRHFLDLTTPFRYTEARWGQLLASKTADGAAGRAARDG